MALEVSIAPISKLVKINNGLPQNFQYNCNSNEIKSHLGIKNGKFIIGTVGHFRPQKDYYTFLQSAKKILQIYPHTYFVIIGYGQQEKTIKEWIKLLKLEGNIKIINTQDNILPLYNIMNIMLLTSLWEGLPYTILEAMSMKVPVVATKVAGSQDVIIHDKTGILVPPGNVNEIVNAVIDLAKNLEKRKHLGENAVHMISQKFTAENMITLLESLYSGNM